MDAVDRVARRRSRARHRGEPAPHPGMRGRQEDSLDARGACARAALSSAIAPAVARARDPLGMRVQDVARVARATAAPTTRAGSSPTRGPRVPPRGRAAMSSAERIEFRPARATAPRRAAGGRSGSRRRLAPPPGPAARARPCAAHAPPRCRSDAAAQHRPQHPQIVDARARGPGDRSWEPAASCAVSRIAPSESSSPPALPARSRIIRPSRPRPAAGA